MEQLIYIGVGILGAAAIAGLRAGLKTYRKKGKLDADVIADALEAGLDEVENKKK